MRANPDGFHCRELGTLPMRLSRSSTTSVWSRCPSSQGCWRATKNYSFSDSSSSYKITMKYITHIQASKPLLYCLNYNTHEVHWEELTHSTQRTGTQYPQPQKNYCYKYRGFYDFIMCWEMTGLILPMSLKQFAFSTQIESKAWILILPTRRNIKLARRQLCEKTEWTVLTGTASQRN